MIDFNRAKKNNGTSGLLPCDPEAEKKVIGALIRDPNRIGVVHDLFEGLHGNPFYEPKNQVIFNALVDMKLKQRQDCIDLITLHNYLELRGEVTESGGPFYIAECANAVATSVNAEFHAKVVLDKAIRRQAIRASAETKEAAYTEDIELLVDRFNRAGKTLLPGTALGGLKSPSEIIPGLLESMQTKLANARDGKRVYKATRTGFSDLDNFTGGMDNHELVILAARPSIGKTSLATCIAYNVAREQGPVFFFSLETPADTVIEAMVCGSARFSIENMRAGHTERDDVDRLLKSMDDVNALPIYIDDNARSIDQIITRAETASDRYGKPRLVVIDYLQLISTPYLKQNNIYERVTEVSRRCQGIPKIMGCPLLLLAQLNREVEKEKRKPRMSDLRESGAIEQDAFQIWFLTLPEDVNKEDEGPREIVVAKNKDGRTGTRELYFHPEFRWFSLIENRYDNADDSQVPF